MDRNQLNQYQLEAVLDDSNACLVNANVGSGKTTVLIEKIRYLHEEKRVPFSQMCVLTFTNKAAGEIRERLLQVSSSSEQDKLLAGTFHGVALKFLQELLPVEELGYRQGFQVMIPEEEVEMALQLIMEQGLKIKYKNRLKKRLEQEGRSEAGRVRYQDDWTQLVDLLTEEKKKQNKMTYRELLIHAAELLRRHPEALQLQWVIIDEVQDCDHLQMEFLEQLKKSETHLFAVGDPNQVIYSWRGSVFQIFPLLRMKYQARELSLPVNYRSTGTILEAAKHFLQNGSQLEGCREEGQKIVVKNHYDSFQEADYLAGKIKELHSQGVAYKEIAVFYRLQNQSEILEKTLRRQEIPCQVAVKKSMRDIPVLNWFYHVLKAALYPDDETSMVQALCEKQYGEGWTAKKAAKELEKEKNGQVTEEGQRTKHGNTVKNQKAESLAYRICHLTENMKKELGEKARISEWTRVLPKCLGLENQILPTSASYQEEMGAVRALLDQLSAGITEAEKKKSDRKQTMGTDEPQMNLESWITETKIYLNQLALSGMHMEEITEESEGESQAEAQASDTVKLMTLHASKGLEFSYVFLIGVNNGLIPLLSGGMEAEEEERRLFFVGMTRAKEYLELSWYTSTDNPRIMPGPGRFLRFLPERLIDYPEGTDMGQKSRKDAQAHLQEIKKQVEKSREIQSEMELTQKVSREMLAEEMNEKGAESVTGDIASKEKRVRHVKYGEGKIIEENEMQIVVEFADYGRKEFIRQFALLEYLDE